MKAKPLRTLVAAIAICLAPAIAACGPSAAPTDNPTPAGPAGGGTSSPARSIDLLPTVLSTTVGAVSLQATMGVGFSKHPDDPGIRRMPGLVVDYTLANAGSTALVAHDLVPADLGSASLPDGLNPEHAWVFMEGDVVRVSKQSFDVAPNVNFVVPPTTGARSLPQGASLTGRAYVPLPIALDVPGDKFTAPRGTIAADATTWQFCIQVEPSTPQDRPDDKDPTILRVPVGAPVGGASLVCTAPTPLVMS